MQSNHQTRSLLMGIFLLGCLVNYVAMSAHPAWNILHSKRGSKDHPSFHYAVRVAVEGGNPYDSRYLQQRATDDGIHTEVYPFIYPPPALAIFSWTLPFSAAVSQTVSWAINQACVLALLGVLWRWIKAPLVVLGLTLALYTPLKHNFQVGQINPLIALFATWGYWRWSGGIALAAWMKMSPAILLVPFGLQKKWSALGWAAVVSVLCLLLSAPFLGLAGVASFFTEVLPQLSKGSYNGMSVPLNLNANHSIPNVFHLLFPSGEQHQLSEAAGLWSKIVCGALLMAILWSTRKEGDEIQRAAQYGALTTLMVVTPAYAYEHHLVLLLPATVIAWTAWWKKRLPGWSIVLLTVGTIGIVWPLGWFRRALRLYPEWGWVIRESKLVGVVLIGSVCWWAARTSSAGPKST